MFKEWHNDGRNVKLDQVEFTDTDSLSADSAFNVAVSPECWRRLLRVPGTIRRSVNLKGNQPSIFVGRTDSEAEAPILWPLDAKNQLIRKDPDAGKD